jgi:hypothetical protein
MELEYSLILGHLYYVGDIIEYRLTLWLFYTLLVWFSLEKSLIQGPC